MSQDSKDSDSQSPELGNGSTESSNASTFSDSKIDNDNPQNCFVSSTVTPVDAAGIKVLLVPIGPVRPEKLARWTNAIAQFSHVYIADFLPHIDADLATVYNSNKEQGAIRFQYTMNINEDHEHLEGLQTYRQMLGVIGIIDCGLCQDIDNAYEEFTQSVLQYPTAVCHRCLALDPQPDQKDDIAGVTVVPNVGGSLLFYLKTLINDFAGTMVSALSLMAKSIEDREDLLSDDPADDTIVASINQEGLVATSPTASSNFSGHQGGVSDSHITTMANRLSLATNSGRESIASVATEKDVSLDIATGDNASDVSATGSLARRRRGGEMNRDSIGPQFAGKTLPAAAARSPNMSIKTTTESDNNNDSVNAGRLKKLQGDLYLMSGRLSEAIEVYTASLKTSLLFNDRMWQAVAMEAHCAALLLLCSQTSRRLLVSFLLARASKLMTSNKPAKDETEVKNEREELSLAELLSQVGKLLGQIPLLYEQAYSFAPLLHAESCVREALLLHATREAHLDDPERALVSILHSSWSSTQTVRSTRDVILNTRNDALRSAINESLIRGWAGPSSSLSLTEQLELSSEISAIFREVGYVRKSVFFLRQFLLLAVPILMRTTTTDGAPAVGSGRVSRDRRGTDSRPSSVLSSARPSISSKGNYVGASGFVDGASAFAAVSAAAAAVTINPSNRPNFSPGQDSSRSLPMSLNMRGWMARSKASLRQAVIACMGALLSSFPDSSIGGNGQQPEQGWLHPQTDILRECLAIAEAIACYPYAIASAFRLVSCLKRLLDTVTSDAQRRAINEEQHMLKNYLQRTIGYYHQQQQQHLQRDHSDNTRGRRVVGKDSMVMGGALDSLLVDMQFYTPAGRAAPIPASREVVSETQKVIPLFLYNPSAKIQEDTPPLFIADESSYVVATLENPFPFALDLSDIRVIGNIDSATDGSIESNTTQCTIPAGGSGQVLLKLTPKIPGKLLIAGIRMSLFQHLTVDCLSAEETDADISRRLKERPLRQRLEKERKELLNRNGSTKSSPTTINLSRMSPGYALCTTVISAMPSLSVIGADMLDDSSLTLLEGESRIVKFTLVNSSKSVVADDIKITFEPLIGVDKQHNADSDSRFSGSKLRDLASAAFSYRQESKDSVMAIKPQDTCCLQIRVDGIAGLNGGEIVVRYGSSETEGWSRELRWPLLVSVTSLIAPGACRFLQLPPYITRSLHDGYGVENTTFSSDCLISALKQVYEKHTGKQHSSQDLYYLVELNFDNLGYNDVDFTIEVDLSHEVCSDAKSLYTKGKPEIDTDLIGTFTARISKGPWPSSRILIPVPRVNLSEQILISPIPGVEADGGPDCQVFYPWRTLLSTKSSDASSNENDTAGVWINNNNSKNISEQQFVVSNTKVINESEVSVRRVMFWYLQDIISRIRMQWRCPQTGKSGFVDPRAFVDALDEHILNSVVRPYQLYTRVLVDGDPVACIDSRQHITARCKLRAVTMVELELVNQSSTVLESAEFSAFMEKGEDVADATSEAKISNAVHRNYSGINLAFVPSLLKEHGSDGHKFRFKVATTTTSKDNQQQKNAAINSEKRKVNNPLQNLHTEPKGRSVVFDSIRHMQLPSIAPNSSHKVKLPLYIPQPGGNHHLKYHVLDRNSTLSQEGVVTLEAHI